MCMQFHSWDLSMHQGANSTSLCTEQRTTCSRQSCRLRASGVKRKLVLVGERPRRTEMPWALAHMVQPHGPLLREDTSFPLILLLGLVVGHNHRPHWSLDMIDHGVCQA